MVWEQLLAAWLHWFSPWFAYHFAERNQMYTNLFICGRCVGLLRRVKANNAVFALIIPARLLRSICTFSAVLMLNMASRDSFHSHCDGNSLSNFMIYLLPTSIYNLILNWHCKVASSINICMFELEQTHYASSVYLWDAEKCVKRFFASSVLWCCLIWQKCAHAKQIRMAFGDSWRNTAIFCSNRDRPNKHQGKLIVCWESRYRNAKYLHTNRILIRCCDCVVWLRLDSLFISEVFVISFRSIAWFD